MLKYKTCLPLAAVFFALFVWAAWGAQKQPAQPSPNQPRQAYLRSVNVSKEGLRVLVEVINTDQDARKVAFYYESFPRSWPPSKVLDEAGHSYDPICAYAWQEFDLKMPDMRLRR